MSSALEKSDGATLANLRLGQHAICLYDGDRDKLDILVAMVEQALERHEKIFCVIDEAGQDSLIRELQLKNRDVGEIQKSGQLSFLFPANTERRREGADSQALLAFYESAFYRAKAQGYSGLRALGVMDAFIPPHGDGLQLVTFEAMLHTKVFAAKSVMVCFYCKTSSRPALLLEIIKVHPWIILDGQLNDNAFHLPPDVFLSVSRAESEFAHTVQTLAEPRKAPALPDSPPPAAETPPPPALEQPARDVPAPPSSLAPEPTEPDRLVRLLKALNACYPALFQASGEKKLLEDACRLLVGQGCCRMAWAGLTDPGADRLIRPVAECGFEPGFLASLHVSAAAGPAEGPASTALQTGKPAILRHILTDPAGTPWRRQASHLGYGSVACLPLAAQDQTLGILTLFATGPDAFSPDEAACFEQLARTLGLLLLALRDRSKQDQLEENGRQREAILRTLDQPVLYMDAEGIILFANTAFLRAWEFDHAQDVLGQPFPALIGRTDQAAILLRQLQDTGRAFGRVQARLKSGLRKDVQIDATTVRDELGRPVNILALFGAGSDERLHEKWLALEHEHEELAEKAAKMAVELKAALDAVDVASRSKNDFLAGMSHELRTPLNAIIGFSEVLLEPTFGALNPKQSEYLSHILESGVHLQSLIDDILTISKVETGTVSLQPGPVALRPLLDESLAPFGGKCENQGLSLRLVVQESAAELTFQADAPRLKQVLANLLDNAVKFTPEGGQILVTARLLKNARDVGADPDFPAPYRLPHILQRQPAVAFPGIEIAVSDSGLGVEKEHHELVFAEFFQVRHSPHRKPAGTGLGLALTRRFVNMHGGQVWVESAGAGQGSRLICFLPLNPETKT